eukprot:3054598-Prymnesium_polylepis.1
MATIAALSAATAAAALSAATALSAAQPASTAVAAPAAAASGPARAVGATLNRCPVLACIGGTMGTCGPDNPGGAGVRVTCG